MRSELLELERQEAAERMGYDAWAAMQARKVDAFRRTQIIREQEREVDPNERYDLVPDRREY
nr:MAG TPA: hypothetical protein [Caudoviricetes sp.]